MLTGFEDPTLLWVGAGLIVLAIALVVVVRYKFRI